MNIFQAIEFLEYQTPDPSQGLPDEIFYFISRTTPLVNVDLLIKDDNGQTLLAWRNDPYAGRGWHVPGGIVRFKETFEERIRKVAESELGVSVTFDPTPLALNQLIHKERDTRGHFISLLYKCYLPASYVPSNKGLAPGDRGYLQWHDSCPDDLIPYHEMYRGYL
jgi:ADP-ribose pyrophosphatase YjhB (NUDIX family)